jgi:hypothetical protein
MSEAHHFLFRPKANQKNFDKKSWFPEKNRLQVRRDPNPVYWRVRL